MPEHEVITLCLKYLALFSTLFFALTLYEKRIAGSAAFRLLNDAAIVMVPLLIMFLLIERDLSDAVIAGALVSLVEYIRSHVKMAAWVRYGLWLIALCTAIAGLPVLLLVSIEDQFVPLAISIALWFVMVFLTVEYSGRRAYDVYLLALFVSMHVFVIWMTPQIANQLGNDVLMLGVAVLSFAVWRDNGGSLVYSRAITGFAAVWLGYIWLNLIYGGYLPVVLILVAYPLLSRIIGVAGKARQLIDNRRGNWLLIIGTAVVTAAATFTCMDDSIPPSTDWMIVTFVYIASTICIASIRSKPEAISKSTET